ncbi:hypothetical protein [Bradyrhizobium sp. CB2312]|uniref:hypothetical protein n=1 Tax=Bradyrhizobium sp. CB2312 TaxID=3039155 RepID=UPI0024B1C04A|nr:hypothetical protein [Bradyrhizobium sp. CB2312]WFU75052.1 hypothetical protein QA642_13990 [Bradyrhizobium sp. CB2312]
MRKVADILARPMPQAGEDRHPVADVFASVYAKCIDLLAAERIVLDGEPVVPIGDLRQARELALLICKSEEAVETNIAHCDVTAHDLLMPYGDVVNALATILRIKRTLDGVQIDEIIRGLEGQKALTAEQRRRAEWARCVLAADWFCAQCDHIEVVRVTRFALNRVSNRERSGGAADAPGRSDLEWLRRVMPSGP